MGWCWPRRTRCQQVPLPTTAMPCQGQSSRWPILVPTLPGEMSAPTAPPKHPSWAARASLHPKGLQGSENRYEPNGKTNIWPGRRGTINSFLMISVSPALPATLGHWKPKSLLDQGWPGFDSATSVPHKKFTCGLPGWCSSTWVAAGLCWHRGWGEGDQQEPWGQHHQVSAGENHTELLPPPASAQFLTALGLSQGFNIYFFHSIPCIYFLQSLLSSVTKVSLSLMEVHTIWLLYADPRSVPNRCTQHTSYTHVQVKVEYTPHHHSRFPVSSHRQPYHREPGMVHHNGQKWG